MFELPNLDELETNLSMARAHAASQRRFVGQPEELLEAWFDREHPTFVRKRRTYEARFKHLSDISQRLRNKRSLWNFFVVDRRLRQVGLQSNRAMSWSFSAARHASTFLRCYATDIRVFSL